ncbi:endonuclease/exonuclease/phosphatase family protein [Microbacterium sp. 179-I 3D4 NHS]|uniref:endonuclease/exonuclease/phosphatase family protein n=1 Tax=Microbacterium sp. 179-I 3D4 NHS TaxID=3142381 RepID=UPI0039A07DCE
MSISASVLVGPTASPDLHVMTFNVRRAMEGPLRPTRDRWSTRAPAVRALLCSERPTLLGVQEALPRVMPVLREALGAGYRGVGRGRGRDGGGEGNPLLYDAARLSLHASGQRALSDRPDEPGSIGWGNLIPRVMVWAELEDRATGIRFLAVNTHLDHLSARARLRSADAVRAIVRERSLPAVVMGDLNAGATSPAVRALLSDHDLRDAAEAADRRLTPDWGTYPGYRRPRLHGRRIDLIAVTPGVRVGAYGANARTFEGRRPSDHLPVQAILRIGKEPA